MSRRYGGIHFRQADVESRRMGRQISERVWQKAEEYFTGRFNAADHLASMWP